jgi:hypothetical protein
MATDLLFDKLAYKDKLTASGVPEATARAHADALDEALREGVATKSDVALVRKDLAITEQRLKIWTGGVAAAAVSALFAALHYWPPHT